MMTLRQLKERVDVAFAKACEANSRHTPDMPVVVAVDDNMFTVKGSFVRVYRTAGVDGIEFMGHQAKGKIDVAYCIEMSKDHAIREYRVSKLREAIPPQETYNEYAEKANKDLAERRREHHERVLGK